MNNSETIGSYHACNLKTAAYFIRTSAPLFDGRYVYAIDINRNAHMYSMKTSKWMILTNKATY